MPRRNERFNEQIDIIEKDVYLFRKYNGFNNFGYVLDIGANLGLTSIVANVLNPHAKIFTFEPAPRTFEYLVDNLEGFNNISLFQIGLGNGESFFMSSSNTETGHMMSEVGVGNMVEIQTMTITDIVKMCKIDFNQNTFLKVDCEGAERYMLDTLSTETLKQFTHIGMEVHFKKRNKSNWDHLPDWDTYNTWVYANFSASHDIIYHNSSKVKGIGIYVITRKIK